MRFVIISIVIRVLKFLCFLFEFDVLFFGRKEIFFVGIIV